MIVAQSGAYELIDYTNWKGERSKRAIIPLSISYDSYPPYHKEQQWLLAAYDVDKKKNRVYALSNIHSWNGRPVSVVGRVAD